MKRYVGMLLLIIGLSCNTYKVGSTTPFKAVIKDTLNKVIQKDSVALTTLIKPLIAIQRRPSPSNADNEAYYQSLLNEIRSTRLKIDTTINFQKHIISKEDSLKALVVAYHHSNAVLKKDTSELRKTAIVSNEIRTDASTWNYMIQFCIGILILLFLFSVTTMIVALWIARTIRLKNHV